MTRLLRSKVFAATAVLVLGLGLGVNMVLFHALYALLWRPLEFPQPEQLVVVEGRSKGGDLSEWITGQNAWALRQHKDIVAELGVVRPSGPVTLLYNGEPVELAAAMVDSGYCRALRLRPVVGRLFGEDEDRGSGGELPVLLTEQAWKRHFGGDAMLIQRTLLRPGAASVRIVGILPSRATLPFAAEAELLLPIASASSAVRGNFGDALYRSVGRLAEGKSVLAASSAADAAIAALERSTPYGLWGTHWLTPLRNALAPASRQTVFWLYGSACLLLLLTCANVASLFAARAIARSHETSIQLALGATLWRLGMERFREAFLLCATGTVAAFFVEAWARPLVLLAIPELKRVGVELLTTGPALIGFGCLLCMGVALAVSAVSLWRLKRAALLEALARGGRTLMGEARPLRAVLSSAQLALVLTLLTLAGLAGRSFLAAAHTDVGIDPRGVVTFRAAVPKTGMSIPAIGALQEQIASLGGVQRVAFAAELPVGVPAFSTSTSTRTGPLLPSDPMIGYRLVSGDYFETLGARLLAGRAFARQEVENGQAVAVLNQSAARLLFAGTDPLGKMVHSGYMDRQSLVVGVVNDIRSHGMDRPAPPVIYLAYLPGWGLRFLARIEGSPQAFAETTRRRVQSWNKAVTLQQFQPLGDVLEDTVRRRIVAAWLTGAFALLGLLISSVGLYGTLAGQVQQQRREIAVRMALGASEASVISLVLREGARIVAVGALAGALASALVGKLVEKQLYGVGPLDPAAFVGALAVLAVAAFGACLAPALRAARVDPMRLLNVQ
ncbi:MAG: ABC transporter permease [Acidobacteria bacterium]|nr:ABC transporter permease [Acidobacteriota bacterium]